MFAAGLAVIFGNHVEMPSRQLAFMNGLLVYFLESLERGVSSHEIR